jgi:hypothetical protein
MHPAKPLETFKAFAEAALLLKAEEPPPPPPADQFVQSVLWLVHVAPSVIASAFAADVLQRLVHLANVDLQHAWQLVAAGVCIPYAQLLSAARIIVPGVEV